MIRMTIALSTFALIAAPAIASRIGAPAPDFVALDSNGKPVKLSSYKGKAVVLEWNNPGCPFVQKHYKSGNMQKAQTTAKDAGVVWLTVNSAAPGKQGHLDGAQANTFVKQQGATPAAYVLDPKGVIGRLYDAKTTPEMALINAEGNLVYRGAIDDKPTADVADIKSARNHLLAALAEMQSGKPISVAESRPYGCTVKYAS